MITLADADATARVGTALAALVRGGDAIALVGDLGAGKTTLVAGLARALGAPGAHSPTFALVHEYRPELDRSIGRPAKQGWPTPWSEGPPERGSIIVWHVDLYRIERAAELPELGLDDLFGDPRGIVIVEWADRWDVVPGDHLRLELTHEGDARALALTGTGPRGEQLARLLLEEVARW